MDKGDIERIRHIKLNCEDIYNSIERFGNSFDVFSGDVDFKKSVSMSIMQVGELSGGLTEKFRKATRDQIPWKLIKSMRNHFVHGYTTMDELEIWETATKDIPHLLSFCNRVIAENT